VDGRASAWIGWGIARRHRVSVAERRSRVKAVPRYPASAKASHGCYEAYSKLTWLKRKEGSLRRTG